MHKKIYKYKLQITDKQQVQMPKDSLLLSVHRVGEDLCLYALVDPNTPQVDIRHIEVVGTGNPIKYDMGIERKFLGTVVLLDGKFVAHVFERIN